MASTSSQVKENKPSFYKRILPDSCIGFASQSGRDIFKSALVHNGLKSFYSLIQQFSTQTEPAYCGLTTLVLVLNALAVDPQKTWKGPWRWYSEEMLNCCVSLKDVQQTGITLLDFRCLAKCQGLTVKYAYADESDAGRMRFRAAVQQACVDEYSSSELQKDEEKGNVFLVASYSRKVLQQTGSGHFSPIAAYDPVSDQVLILDTARFKYGAHWTKLDLFYDAMVPIDKDTGKSRGYFLLSFEPTSKATSTDTKVQPISLLFASKLSQSPARQKYKEYLNSRKEQEEVAWEQVLEYWISNNGCNNNICNKHSVWDILEPLSNERQDKESQTAIKNLQEIIQDLQKRAFKLPPDRASLLAGSLYRLHHHAALLLVYLASISPTSRLSILETNFPTKKYSRLTKEQLLNEAELIATAIETSDENDLCLCYKCCKK